MIFSTLVSFLGGSAFRMLWGEISSWLSARQAHSQELDMIRMQGELQAQQHARNLEAIRVQSELGVQTIRVQGDADVSRADADAFTKAVDATMKSTGIWIVDLWNGIIRPAGATLFLALVTLHFYRRGWVLDEQGWTLAGAFLGIYVADRALFKRGK